MKCARQSTFTLLTDVVIMLLRHHHQQNHISDIYFPQERRKNGGALKKLPKKIHAKNICEINSLKFAEKKQRKTSSIRKIKSIRKSIYFSCIYYFE